MAAQVVVVLVGVAVPGIGDLDPPWSESPSGLFLILGRVVVYGSLAATSLGALVAVLMPGGDFGVPRGDRAPQSASRRYAARWFRALARSPFASSRRDRLKCAGASRSSSFSAS